MEDWKERIFEDTKTPDDNTTGDRVNHKKDLREYRKNQRKTDIVRALHDTDHLSLEELQSRMNMTEAEIRPLIEELRNEEAIERM